MFAVQLVRDGEWTDWQWCKHYCRSNPNVQQPLEQRWSIQPSYQDTLLRSKHENTHYLSAAHMTRTMLGIGKGILKLWASPGNMHPGMEVG